MVQILILLFIVAVRPAKLADLMALGDGESIATLLADLFKCFIDITVYLQVWGGYSY